MIANSGTPRKMEGKAFQRNKANNVQMIEAQTQFLFADKIYFSLFLSMVMYDPKIEIEFRRKIEKIGFNFNIYTCFKTYFLSSTMLMHVKKMKKNLKDNLTTCFNHHDSIYFDCIDNKYLSCYLNRHN